MPFGRAVRRLRVSYGRSCLYLAVLAGAQLCSDMATLSSSPSLFTRFARSRKTRSVASDSASSRSTSSKEVHLAE